MPKDKLKERVELLDLYTKALCCVESLAENNCPGPNSPEHTGKTKYGCQFCAIFSVAHKARSTCCDDPDYINKMYEELK